jgi:hypothetical protein
VATPRGPAIDPVDPTFATTIEPAGASVSHPAGGLTLSVPAGAVSAPTQLTVTPIANTARGAIGPAFRLGPEGATFAAPVTLTFAAPASYPVGTSIAGVGIEYQDARGFWHRAEPVTRDAVAKTVSVSTTHFSDWALTWQGGTAAAEGEITLVQTIGPPWGVPFTATGRATVFFQEDTATDTYYSLTGTLTVPATIVDVDGATCVPDQTTKTLPFNLAEAHKSTPPVFRWGIGVHWTLTCDAAPTERLMPAMFDTMFINLTRCPADYAPGQVVSADQLAGAYTKDCGADGLVSATWDLRACVAGLDCLPAECRLGVTACDAGIQSCVETDVAPNDTACGAGGASVCSEGLCVDPSDPGAGIAVTPASGLVTTEAGGTGTFQLVLANQPTTTVAIALSSSSAEGTVSPASVTFTPADWDVAQIVTVTGADDFVDDGDVAYTVLTAPAVSLDPRYGGRDPADVSVTNTDDDAAGIVVSPTSGLFTTESGGTATFTVVLQSQPTADVIVPFRSSYSAEGTVSPASLTFTPLDWDAEQLVTVTGVDDGDPLDGPQTYFAETDPAESSDPVYSGFDASDVEVTNNP